MSTVRKLPPTEEEEHLAFMEWVKHIPEIRDLILHIPNEGKRNIYYANKLKRMGLRKGVADFFIPLPIKGSHGLWIELKRTDGSRETPEQIAWIKRMCELDYAAEFAYGFDDAREIVIDYLKTGGLISNS